VIDLESGASLLTHELEDGVTIAPLTLPDAVRLSSDGRRLVVAFDNLAQGDGTVSGVDVVDVATGSLEWRYTHEPPVAAPLTLELSPNGRHAVIVAKEAGGRSRVRHLDIEAQRTAPLTDHEATFVTAAVDDDGSITTASSSGTIRFLGSDGEPRAPSIRLALELHAVARTGDGRVVASLSGGGAVVVHETDMLIADAKLTPEGPIRIAASGLVTGLEAGGERLLVWQTIGERPGTDPDATIDLSLAHPGGAWFWRESNNSRWVLTAGPIAGGNGLGVSDLENGTTHVVDLEEIYQRVFSAPFHPAAPLAPRVGDDGRVFLRASLRTGEAAAMWIDPTDGSILVGPTSVDSFHGPVLLLDDGRVVAGSPGAPTQVLSADLDGIELIGGGTLFAVPLAHDPRTGLVLVGGTGGLIALVDPDLGTHRELQRVRGQVSDGAFSPDGSTIAVQAVGSGVHLLDVATGLVIGAPLGTDGSGLSSGMAWSDDGSEVRFVHRGAVTSMAADAATWVELACRAAGRDLSLSEWERYVSTWRPHAALCGR
jgi:WD40 repeat protein